LPRRTGRLGGATGRSLRQFTERWPVVCHGLSLSLGGPAPLDELLLTRVRKFMRAHGMDLYTEHLSYTTDDGQLYDLLPIPFTADAVRHVARRIRRAQEILERRIAVENASYYVAAPMAELSAGVHQRRARKRIAGCIWTSTTPTSTA
jgi:uncharacterized protein (UPF0276 family)